MGQRCLVDNEFAVRVLDSMFFNSFVQERGLPFRSCDLFDDVSNCLCIVMQVINVYLSFTQTFKKSCKMNQGIETQF